MDTGPRRFDGREYDDLLQRWTRHSEYLVFQGLDERLLVDATYHSWEFRWALTARQARDRTLEGEDALALRDQSMVAWRAFHEFYIALSTVTPRAAELHRPNPVWTLSLVDDRGRRVAPARFERVRRPGPNETVYYPYTSPWRTVYRVYFPTRQGEPGNEWEVLGPGTRWFLLRFAGSLGTVDLRWDVERSDAGAPSR